MATTSIVARTAIGTANRPAADISSSSAHSRSGTLGAARRDGPHSSCYPSPDAAVVDAVGGLGSVCVCQFAGIVSTPVEMGPHGSWYLPPEAATAAAVGGAGSALVCLF